MATEIRLKLKLKYATVQAPATLAGLSDVLLSALQNDQILAYDTTSGSWYNISPATLGLMLKATYDPTNKNGDAFSMDNMVETATKKILLATERTLIAGAEQATNKGSANGYAPLDGGSLVPLANLPASVKTGSEYKGAWNAATNTPTLANGVGTNGDYYRCSVAGSVNLGAGLVTFEVGDTVVYDGTLNTWDRIGRNDAILSVNGFTGVVVLTADNIAETATRKWLTDIERTKLAGLNASDYLAKDLEFNDQRGLGSSYSLQASDLGKMVIVDNGVTIPSGLPTSFQCAIAQANATKQALTINAAYTTKIGAPAANLSPDGVSTLAVVNSSTIIFTGPTEV